MSKAVSEIYLRSSISCAKSQAIMCDILYVPSVFVGGSAHAAMSQNLGSAVLCEVYVTVGVPFLSI